MCPDNIGTGRGRSHRPAAGHVGIFEVSVGTVCPSIFIGAGKRYIIVIALPVDVAQVSIHGGQFSLYPFLCFEITGFINTARLFVQEIRTCHRQEQ
ncbi:hypothetical protein Barb7_02431 [Bacteroidales bacterium Barb7]|nr:hypothetical protein Barb7_02431 [Bacteroidales bacterium Barb7]